MKPITIVGGGIAGLTLGILLRREAIPAMIAEAGHYPRHRVCGEFISGRGLSILRELGLAEKLRAAGAVDARDAAFFALLRKGAPIHFPLPDPALCLSRYRLDALLADEFVRAGGELRTGLRVSSNGEGVLRACGRRRASGRGFLFGLKAHARGAALRAGLEMHFAPDQYVGISRSECDLVNVCGLFYSSEPAENLANRWPERLASSVEGGVLDGVEWDQASYCAVAGLDLISRAGETEFAIGDAAGMIPPLTGNGMSMALESAKLAIEPLRSFSRGTLTWTDAILDYRRHWKRQFDSRLRWAGWLQRQLFSAKGQRCLTEAAHLCPRLTRLFFRLTR